jgi:hypothetical protein
LQVKKSILSNKRFLNFKNVVEKNCQQLCGTFITIKINPAMSGAHTVAPFAFLIDFFNPLFLQLFVDTAFNRFISRVFGLVFQQRHYCLLQCRGRFVGGTGGGSPKPE